MASSKDFLVCAATPVAIQTTARTMMEIIAATGKVLTLKQAGVSFDGSVAAAGLLCELILITATGTGTTATPRALDQSAAPTISATAKYNDTVEPTVSWPWLTAFVPPSSSDRWIFPLDDEIVVPVGQGIGLRVTGAASNVPKCAPFFLCSEA